MAQDGSSFAERARSKVKGLAGSVLGDRTLKREAELHEDKADAIEDRDRLEAEAERQRHEVELSTRAQELEAERALLDAEHASDVREAGIDQERRAAEARIEAERLQQERVVEATSAGQRRAADVDEARSAEEHADRVREAAAIEAAAAQARADAESLDQGVTGTETR